MFPTSSCRQDFDPHMNYDAQICGDLSIGCSSYHGETSVVMGNCAVGIVPCRIEAREVAAWDLVNVEAIPFDALTNAFPDIIKNYAPALVLFGSVLPVGRWRRLNAAPTRLNVCARLYRFSRLPSDCFLIAREFYYCGYT
jgi:N-acyl-D-aspartate/D-glutamate deacylase